MNHNIDKQICFYHQNKIYLGKITNEIGIKYKEYKVIALEDNGELLICWIKASQIIQDRRWRSKDRRSSSRRKNSNEI